MKKIFTLIFFLSIPYVLSAQWNGDGLSASTAYYGVINSSNPMQAWNITNFPGGIIFVGRSISGQNDLEVNGGGTLIISQGITVKFCTTLSDLRITGTGVLNASGSSSSVITFTKNAQATWGHISFQTMDVSAGLSTINNCVIEYGDVSSTLLTPANPNQYGGAIQADFSNLSISNCEISNCKAGWGGGLFINIGRNPSITNCYIHNNTSTTSGGGIYFYQDSYSTISNSIITYNSCTGAGGGGGIFIGNQALNVNVINCVISHNNANSQSLGHNIRFFNNTRSTKPQIINTIIWYPANSIIYNGGGGPLVTDFKYCAIQTPPITYTNCITLNASNTDPAGPNFIDPDLPGLNWSIPFISPCRDAGTTPSPTIPNDYIGNPRIGPYDIGAYEVQYSRWAGTTGTDWAAATNWVANVDPTTGTGDVIIPTGLTNYPTGSSLQNFTIGTGKFMILKPGAKATLGILTNNGTLQLQSDATGISSLILNSHLGNAANVQLYLTGGYIGNPALRVGRWHYISSPFDPSTPLSISPFTANTYDLARWVDGIQSPASILLGFVGFDGYVYNDSDPSDPGTFWGGTFSTLITGRGYNYWDNLSSFNYSLTGKLNTSDVAVNLDFAGAAYENGYNLLGNPFSSGLNWDDIINSVYFTYPSNTSKSLYITRNNVTCTYIAGVGVPGDVTGLIPPMQGFFTKTYSTGNTITLAAAARVHNIHARYKGQTIIPLVRLEIDKDSLSKDETVVRFDDKALSTLDNEFDALKMFLSASTTSIYSSDGVSKYSINGQPFPGTAIEIPVVINLQYSGNHKISTNQLQGLDNYYVTLKDNTTGFIADLKTTPELSFSAAAGTTSGRFILKITNLTTGVENPVVSNNIFNIYPGQNLINIQTIADEWDGRSGSVRLLDLTGKTVTDLQKAEFRKNSVIQVQAPAATGLYVVEIRSGVKRYVGKVVIR